MAVLGKSEIEKRLGEGEIFMPESWHGDYLRAAGYDLRIATDYLITPDGTRYWPNGSDGRKKCDQAITLEPGQVAFVSTVERLCMPLDVAGNIADKFDLARRGLLVMGGLLVDPGYGLELSDDGRKPASLGERLHFQLANTGDETLILLPGQDKIAGIQFLELKGTANGAEENLEDISVPTSAELLESLFDRGSDRPLKPLAFFSRTRKLEERVKGKLTERVKTLEKQGRKRRIELQATQRSTELVVVFGVFLITITLFTVAVAALLGALANGSVSDMFGGWNDVDLTWTAIVVAVGMLALVGIACLLMMRPVVEIARRGRKKKKGKKKP